MLPFQAEVMTLLRALIKSRRQQDWTQSLPYLVPAPNTHKQSCSPECSPSCLRLWAGCGFLPALVWFFSLAFDMHVVATMVEPASFSSHGLLFPAEGLELCSTQPVLTELELLPPTSAVPDYIKYFSNCAELLAGLECLVSLILSLSLTDSQSPVSTNS